MSLQLTQEQQDLVVNNHKLVYYLVQKLGIPPSDYDDMVSIGTIGLCKAAAKFDANRQTKFSTYASRCIHNEIFMYFRKNKKQILSLDDPFSTNAESNAGTLGELLFDPISSDFEKQVENTIIITQSLSYILNCLSYKETIILLLSIANVKQKEIAHVVGVAQSYISRLAKKLYSKVKNHQHSYNYKEVYTVQLKDDRLEISFSTTAVKQFNQIFANFLIGISNVQDLQNFRLNYTHGQVVISLPAETESFAFIAQIIQEIENFRVDFTGVSP